jgi:hypothetical protein
MKHRFYGDKKDYIKYGLLDVLSSGYRAIGINWYLTDDHHGNPNHGDDTRYLDTLTMKAGDTMLPESSRCSRTG